MCYASFQAHPAKIVVADVGKVGCVERIDQLRIVARPRFVQLDSDRIRQEKQQG
jgi:hypothetical protein